MAEDMVGALGMFAHDRRWEDLDPSLKRLGDAPLESLEDLRRFSDSCYVLVAVSSQDGASELLRVARSLFEHSWLDIDFLGVSVMISLQTIETLLRQMYPNEQSVTLWELINRVEELGLLSPELVAVLHGSRDLRNDLSHPLTVVPWEPGHAVLVLQTAHRFHRVLSQHAW